MGILFLLTIVRLIIIFLLYKMITDNQYNFLKVNSFMKEIKEKLSNNELNSINAKVKKMKKIHQ